MPQSEDDMNDDLSDESVQKIREREYPSLHGAVYLDHAGTTPVAQSLINRFSADMIANLYGNPHSSSPSSQQSTRRIDDIRHAALRFFNADPAHFDLVFVSNATAGIKLVMDAFRDNQEGFWYGYHKDSHTSLVGVREVARSSSRCFVSDEQVEHWLDRHDNEEHHNDNGAELFAYPAQSNMNGRRLPLGWCQRLRRSIQDGQCRRYSLLDAAAYVSTCPLDLGNPDTAPDFTVLSFYKIFGFPDLGALIVRKNSADILRSRSYFGGGTVDVVVSIRERWHVNKTESVHAALEDGTLPIHNIFALGHALDVHRELFGSLSQVSKRLANLAQQLYENLSALTHINGEPLCVIYKDEKSTYYNSISQGPVVSFNMRNASGAWIINSEVEKLASIRNIHLRAGGLCNPGGIATSLGLEPWEVKQNFSAGHRCGSENDVVSGKPTGMLRVSLGAMSTKNDVDIFISFLREFFVEGKESVDQWDASLSLPSLQSGDFCVETLTIYPIKSCAGWKVPVDRRWEIRKEGLAWDREWCLIHQGTGAALSQKRYPQMALLRPSVDLVEGMLRIRYNGPCDRLPGMLEEVAVPLSADPDYFERLSESGSESGQSCSVCGDDVNAMTYTSPAITEFFSSALGVACHLARSTAPKFQTTARKAKARIQHHQILAAAENTRETEADVARPILLSNESPILIISRSSLNRLNEQIKARGGKAVQAEAFRANIVVSQSFGSTCGSEQPYIEDYWRGLQIGGQYFQMLGSCRRCQMVCVDQNTAQKNEEPFVTLASTRRFGGRVWFGQHMCHMSGFEANSPSSQCPTVMVGEPATPIFPGKHWNEMLRKTGIT